MAATPCASRSCPSSPPACPRRPKPRADRRIAGVFTPYGGRWAAGPAPGIAEPAARRQAHDPDRRLRLPAPRRAHRADACRPPRRLANAGGRPGVALRGAPDVRRASPVPASGRHTLPQHCLGASRKAPRQAVDRREGRVPAPQEHRGVAGWRGSLAVPREAGAQVPRRLGVRRRRGRAHRDHRLRAGGRHRAGVRRGPCLLPPDRHHVRALRSGIRRVFRDSL